ncbi:hypothetical protein [Paraburkholderia sp.]|uniref:hypothetical protein n=1 Tax=Paraburkholderia sp. TaxID=1926495 RepID=UPI002D28622F|nr:hypothetical protein [Paraburkholderia sp.]HZZ04617.1 hypothetical protein [Paraburkholderia sp.]
MGKLTKDEMKKIADELRHAFGRVELQCDAYRVNMEVRPLAARRYAIAVFVDGWMRGEWLRDDCEQRRRFMRCRNVPLYSAAKRARIEKELGKRYAKRLGVDKTFAVFYPYWTSVTPMLRQFCATNDTVSVIEIGYQRKAMNIEQPAEAEVADA